MSDNWNQWDEQRGDTHPPGYDQNNGYGQAPGYGQPYGQDQSSQPGDHDPGRSRTPLVIGMIVGLIVVVGAAFGVLTWMQDDKPDTIRVGSSVSRTGSQTAEPTPSGEAAGTATAISTEAEPARADAMTASPAAPVTVTQTVTATVNAPASSEPSTGSDSRIPDSGTWTGTGYQSATDTRPAREYEVSMTFSSSGSSVRYPGLDCGGSLEPSGFNGGSRVYRERITSGSCDSDGTWEVTVMEEGYLSAQYTPPSGRYTVNADLYP